MERDRLYAIILLLIAVTLDVITLLGEPVAGTFYDSMVRRQSELFSWPADYDRV